jgi:hypothetical protein
VSLESFTLSPPQRPLIARFGFLVLGSRDEPETESPEAPELQLLGFSRPASIDASLDALGATKNFNLVLRSTRLDPFSGLPRSGSSFAFVTLLKNHVCLKQPIRISEEIVFLAPNSGPARISRVSRVSTIQLELCHLLSEKAEQTSPISRRFCVTLDHRTAQI